MPKTKLQLPPLAFGQYRSQVDLDLEQMQSRVNAITNWVSEYDTLGKESAFQHRTSVYANDGVRVLAAASSPTVMRVNDPDYTIAMPIRGSIESWIRQDHYIADESGSALFASKGRRHTEGGNKSCLLISVSEKRLFATGRTMLGERFEDILRPEKPRVVNTKIHNVDFRGVMQQTCNLIDQFNGDLTLLKSFNVDENITRLMVMLLAPHHFVKSENDSSTKGNRKVIDHLCGFIEQNLERSVSLTELESVSGMSSRMLQKEFHKHFSCSPMQWARQQRLALAKKLLTEATPGVTVAHIATTCGYSNFSEFSRQYKERYGMLPSEILKLTRNR
jgi:AraC-like DNA-binding protein